MSSNPANLILRFLLEVTALVSIGMYGWDIGNELSSYIFAAGFPLIAVIVWGVFTVPDDPSRSGKAPVPTAGILRLVIELFVMFFGAYSFYSTGYKTISIVFVLLVLIHYISSYDRIKWLLNK